jgi:flagellar basal body P-ring formation protein FlgA
MTFQRGNFITTGAEWRIVRTGSRYTAVRQTLPQRAPLPGLRWLRGTLLALCLVVTPSAAFAAPTQLDAQMISAALPAALDLPIGTLGETSVQLDNPNVLLVAGETATLDFANLNYDSSTRRFTGLALLREAGLITAQANIAGRVVTELEVPVLARSLQRDEVISARDLAWQRITLSSATQQVLTRAEDIIGKAPRTAVRAGQLLRPADLIAPAIIKRGTLVTLLYQSGRLQLTAKGRALNDAAAGESVRVANASSARTVEGIALNDGTVQMSNVATN